MSADGLTTKKLRAQIQTLFSIDHRAWGAFDDHKNTELVISLKKLLDQAKD